MIKKPKIVIVGISGESVFLETDHFHRSGETITAINKVTEPGGKGYNQAVASSVFGADVTFLTTVGNDVYGKYAISYLEDNNIKVKYRALDEIPTAYATILTDKKGNNQVTVFSGASSYLTVKDVELIEDDIKNADYILLQLEVAVEVVTKIMELAAKNNVKVVLNPAPAILPSNHPIYLKADIITPNEIEARDIFNLPVDLDVMQYGEYLQKIISNIAVITLGDKGCLLVSKDYYQYFEGIKVNAIDTTGAGDIFNAGLVTMLASNKTLEEAIKFALEVSSKSVTTKYVMNSIMLLK